MWSIACATMRETHFMHDLIIQFNLLMFLIEDFTFGPMVFYCPSMRCKQGFEFLIIHFPLERFQASFELRNAKYFSLAITWEKIRRRISLQSLVIKHFKRFCLELKLQFQHSYYQQVLYAIKYEICCLCIRISWEMDNKSKAKYFLMRISWISWIFVNWN